MKYLIYYLENKYRKMNTIMKLFIYMLVLLAVSGCKQNVSVDASEGEIEDVEYKAVRSEGVIQK